MFLVVGWGGEHIDVWLAGFERDGLFVARQHVVQGTQNDVGIGAVARADGHAVGNGGISFQLEHLGTVLHHAFRGYVVELGGNGDLLHGTKVQLDIHACLQECHLSLVDVAAEDDVAHVGNLCHRRSLGEDTGA